MGCEENISVIFPYGSINSNIPLALTTISNQRGLFNNNQPGRTKEKEP